MAENSKPESAKTTKEKAAAARAAALKEEKARRRRTNLLIGGGLLVVIALIVGGVVFASNQNKDTGSSTSLPPVDPNAALPKTVLPSSSPMAYGFPIGTPSATKSTVQVWEDFQCPICGEFEKAQGAQVQQLAADGKIYLVYRPASFLDKNLPQSNLSSARATAAWGCAIDGGVGEKYHNTVFSNQPTKEGDGYTDAQLLDFGKQAGLSGPAYDTFASCVGAKTYLGWTANSAGAFTDAGIPGTPNVQLDGTEIPSAQLGNAAAYIDANRKK
jgi:protein-disulfide isomerase